MNSNLLICSSRHSLQYLWPHLVLVPLAVNDIWGIENLRQLLPQSLHRGPKEGGIHLRWIPPYWKTAELLELGVTTSRPTSGGWRKERNMSGQRGNKFNTSYRDISVIVAENNSVVKPKYQQYTSLNKMLRNFSKVLMAHKSFTAVINNRGIRKGIGGIRKGTKKNYIYVL